VSKKRLGYTGRHQRYMHTEGQPWEDMVRVAIYKPRTDASEETRPADTLILVL